MAAYTVVDVTYGPGTLASVAAAMEVTLETLDSTSNPIYLIDIFQNAVTGQYEGVLLYSG